jgi:hypothetical protein
MAYVPGNLSLVMGALGGTGAQVWSLRGTDASSGVDLDGFITDGGSRGMRVGDIVIYTDTDATPPAVSVHGVNAVSSTYPGAVDLQDGSATTDSD